MTPSPRPLWTCPECGHGNSFRVSRPAELDDDFAALVAEAHAIGRGEG